MKLGKHNSRVDEAISKAAAGVHLAVDKTAQASQSANHSIRDKGHQLLEAEKKWVKAGDRYIHRHPVLVLGAAVAAGFALCAVLRKSRSDADYDEE